MRENLRKRRTTRYKCLLCPFSAYNNSVGDLNFSREHVCQSFGGTSENLETHSCPADQPTDSVTVTSFSPWTRTAQAHNTRLQVSSINSLTQSITIAQLFEQNEINFLNLFK